MIAARRTHGRRPIRRTERGVTVVEASFALPVLFLFIAGLIDIGMWVYNANQAANAARDGARVGILDFETADVSGSADFDAIVAVMQSHLPSRTIDPADVDVQCLDPDNNVVTCATAFVDSDRLMVTIDWTWELVTPIATLMGMTEGAVTGTSTMAIVGRPLPGSGPPPSTSSTTAPAPTSSTSSSSTSSTSSSTTTTTTPCWVSSLTVSPVQAKSNGRLENDVSVAFSTNGVSACGPLTVQIQAPGGGSASEACGCGTSPNHSWVYGKNENSFWTTGTGYARVFNGSSVIATTSFTVN